MKDRKSYDIHQTTLKPGLFFDMILTTGA